MEARAFGKQILATVVNGVISRRSNSNQESTTMQVSSITGYYGKKRLSKADMIRYDAIEAAKQECKDKIG